MRRAALVFPNPVTSPGGGETFGYYLSRLLGKKGFGVRVFHRGILNLPNLLYRNRYLRRFEAYIMTWKLGRLATTNSADFDIGVTLGMSGWAYRPQGVPVYCVYQQCGAAFLRATRHCYRRTIDYYQLRLLDERMERHAGLGRRCIAASPRVGDELRQFYGLHDIVIVPNGIDVHAFSPICSQSKRQELRVRLGLPSDKTIGLFVARWVNTKGSDILRKIIETDGDTVWVLVTSENAREELGIFSNVHLFYDIPNNEMPTFYRATDFFLLPSLYEGFGYAFLEAMSCGVPIITAPVTGIPELHDLLGPTPLLLSRPDDLREIREAIEFIKTHPSDVHGIAARGRKITVEKYSLEVWQENVSRALGI